MVAKPWEKGGCILGRGWKQSQSSISNSLCFICILKTLNPILGQGNCLISLSSPVFNGYILFSFWLWQNLMQLLDFIKITFGNKQAKHSTRIFVSRFFMWLFFFSFPPRKFSFGQRGVYHRSLKKRKQQNNKAIVITLENNKDPLGSIRALFVFPAFVFTPISGAAGTQCYNSKDYNSKSLVWWHLISPLISQGYSHEEDQQHMPHLFLVCSGDALLFPHPNLTTPWNSRWMFPPSQNRQW